MFQQTPALKTFAFDSNQHLTAMLDGEGAKLLVAPATKESQV